LPSAPSPLGKSGTFLALFPLFTRAVFPFPKCHGVPLPMHYIHGFPFSLWRVVVSLPCFLFHFRFNPPQPRQRHVSTKSSCSRSQNPPLKAPDFVVISLSFSVLCVSLGVSRSLSGADQRICSLEPPLITKRFFPLPDFLGPLAR